MSEFPEQSEKPYPKGEMDGLFCSDTFHQPEVNKLLLEITLMMLLLPGHLTVYSGGPEKLINLTSDNLTPTPFVVFIPWIRLIFSALIYI